MNSMEILALILLVFGFFLGFGMATKAAVVVIAEKQAMIEQLKAEAARWRVIANNFRGSLKELSEDHERVITLEPDLTNPVVKTIDLPLNLLLPMVIDSNNQSFNLWLKFLDDFLKIENGHELHIGFHGFSPLIRRVESSAQRSKRLYDKSERTTQQGGAKTKYSSVHGREFGNRRKFKIARLSSKYFKRQQKDAWISYNELYEDELPHTVLKIVSSLTK